MRTVMMKVTRRRAKNSCWPLEIIIYLVTLVYQLLWDRAVALMHSAQSLYLISQSHPHEALLRFWAICNGPNI